MVLRALSYAVVVVAFALADTGAVAQANRDRLRFDTSAEGTQASVISDGKTIRIGHPTEVFQRGRLIDLDGDGAQDALLEILWDDGSVYDVMLRRGERFIDAARIEDSFDDPVLRDVDGNGTMEILVPEPTAEKLYTTLRLFIGRYEAPHDEIRVFGYKANKYAPVRIECVTALRDSYLVGLADLEVGLNARDRRFKDVLYDLSFVREQLASLKASIARWRKKISGGCSSP